MTLFWLVFVLSCSVACAVDSEEKRLEVLESTVKLQYEESEELQRRISELETQIAALKATRSHADRRRNTAQKIRPADLSGPTGLLSKRQSIPNVAFHVYKSTSQCYHIGSAVSFDVKPLDIGGGFAHDNTIFDVPSAGIYVFTWTFAVPKESGKVVTELYVDDSVRGVLTSDPDHGPYTGNGIHPATGLVVLRVSASDHVSIRIKNSPSGCGANLLSDDNSVRTTFSGWKLSD